MTQKRRYKRQFRKQPQFPRIGVVHLAPSRESRTPFCAYYGPKGEICFNTTGLKMVLTLPGPPTYTYMACPLHYQAVSQRVQVFLSRLANSSRQA